MQGADLVGRWALRRTVTDRLAQRSGTVTGELLITVVGARIAWQESGALTWAGRVAPVSRTSYLALRDGEAWMTFADGRPFHPWLPGVVLEHPCGADRYVGCIDVAVDTMHTTWRVTGPTKDQLLVTALVRQSAGERRSR